MSFKVVVKGKDKLFKDIEKALNASLQRTVMNDVGKQAREILYRRVKSGKGVSSDKIEAPTLTRLASHKPSYTKFRSKLASKGFTFGEFGSIGRSNLTLTGQMLDAIIVEARRNGFNLKIADTNRSDGKLTNAAVAEHAGNARPFFALTESEQRILFRNLETKLRAELKKVLGSRNVGP